MNTKLINLFLLIVFLIILYGNILSRGSLVRCVAWPKLGVNGCFVPEADIAYIIVSLFMKKSQRPNAKKKTKSVIC
ncbi:hypothetical protein ACTVKI_11090 [Serratia marcescens]|uniref:hypothetical protein n=1 Tax=Serratia TaxID=613 RepID=UPI0029E323BA|nr:hypothetical protein [Serratia marcescens]HEJ7968584.1 hypothetical protein [Serratia marcescens]